MTPPLFLAQTVSVYFVGAPFGIASSAFES